LLPPKLPASKEWRHVLENEFGFKCISSNTEIPEDALWTTSCSKTKKTGKSGKPKDFYRGRYSILFYDYVEKHKLPYGVISDKYGIHMFDEELEYYDVHPRELTIGDKKHLGRLIREKIKEYGFSELVFYYPSPLLSQPYFEILWFSQLDVNYLTQIKNLFKEIKP